MVKDFLTHPLTITVFTLSFGVAQMFVAYALSRFTRSMDRLSDAISKLQIDGSGIKTTLVEYGSKFQKLDQRVDRLEDRVNEGFDRIDERCQTRCIHFSKPNS